MCWKVRLYRLLVLGFALAGLTARLAASDWTVAEFGWAFRYLTNWALTGSLLGAALMLVPRYGQRDDRAAVFVSTVAALNLLVFFFYWQLYFTDPATVGGSQRLGLPLNLYLHLVGPVLQWVDALVLKRAFRFALRTALCLSAVILAYVLWAEFVIAPLNDAPVGDMAAGLPYPLLNEMAAGERAVFYLAVLGAGAVSVALLRGVEAVVLRAARR